MPQIVDAARKPCGSGMLSGMVWSGASEDSSVGEQATRDPTTARARRLWLWRCESPGTPVASAETFPERGARSAREPLLQPREHRLHVRAQQCLGVEPQSREHVAPH